MPQYGFKDGAQLDPAVTDHLLKKKDANYRAPKSRAMEVLEQLQQLRGRSAPTPTSTSIDPSLVSALSKMTAAAGTIDGQAPDTSAIDEAVASMGNQQKMRLAMNAQDQEREDRFNDLRLKSAVAADDYEEKQQSMAHQLARDRAQRDFEKMKVEDEQSHQLALEGVKGSKVKPSDAQATAAYHASRAVDTEKYLQEMEKKGYDPGSYSRDLRGINIPMTNIRPMENQTDRSYKQAQLEFVASVLREETGAAVTPQEFEYYGSIYFPQPGDGPNIIEQKRVARQRAIDGLINLAGPAYQASDANQWSLDKVNPPREDGAAYAGENKKPLDMTPQFKAGERRQGRDGKWRVKKEDGLWYEE